MEPINLRTAASSGAVADDISKSSIVCVTETSGSNPLTVNVGPQGSGFGNSMQVPANGMVLIRKNPNDEISITAGTGSLTGVSFSAATGISKDAPFPPNPNLATFINDANGLDYFSPVYVGWNAGTNTLSLEVATADGLYAGLSASGMPITPGNPLLMHYQAPPGAAWNNSNTFFGIITNFQTNQSGSYPGNFDLLDIMIPPPPSNIHPTYGHDMHVTAQQFETLANNGAVGLQFIDNSP
tara:strand:- start:1540 stop:2259 length:720 start_codon:yes stop_codon:yes gene_type:complete